MLEIQAIQKSAFTTNGHVVSDPVFCMIPASKDLDTLAGLYKKDENTRKKKRTIIILLQDSSLLMDSPIQ